MGISRAVAIVVEVRRRCVCRAILTSRSLRTGPVASRFRDRPGTRPSEARSRHRLPWRSHPHFAPEAPRHIRDRRSSRLRSTAHPRPPGCGHEQCCTTDLVHRVSPRSQSQPCCRRFCRDRLSRVCARVSAKDSPSECRTRSAHADYPSTGHSRGRRDALLLRNRGERSKNI